MKYKWKTVKAAFLRLRQWAAFTGRVDKRTENDRLKKAVETENWNYRKFRGQWEDAQDALNKYRHGAFEVLTRYGLTSEFYWKEDFWRHQRDQLARSKTVIEFMAEALLRSRKKVRELEWRVRALQTEVPEDRKKEIDDAVRESRKFDMYRYRDPDTVALLTNRIRALKEELHRQQDTAEVRNKQLADLRADLWNAKKAGGPTTPGQ
jgi:hypothetical protein